MAVSLLWLAVAACSGDPTPPEEVVPPPPEEVVDPDPDPASATVRPQAASQGTIEVRPAEAPDEVVALTIDTTGVVAVAANPAALDAWAEASSLLTAEACAGLCLTWPAETSVTLELIAVGGEWSDPGADCAATDRVDTIACTLGRDDQTLAPVAAFPDPEPKAPDCPFQLRFTGTVADATGWNDRVVLAGDLEVAYRDFRLQLIRFDDQPRVAGCLPSTEGRFDDLLAHPDGGFVAGGRFSTFGGVDCRGLARITADGMVDSAFCEDRPEAFFVGGPTVIDGRTIYVASSAVFAIDLDTYEVIATSGSLSFGSYGVAEDLLLHDGTLYLAGNLTEVGGVPAGQLTAFDVADLSVEAFAPSFDDEVRTIEVIGDQLWAGGDFETVDGQPRAGIAVFDLATGALNDLDLSLARGVDDGVRVSDVAPSDDGVWVAGRFDSARGEARAGHVLVQPDGALAPDGADLETTSSSDVWVRQITERAGVVFLTGDFDRVDGASQLGYASFQLADGQPVPTIDGAFRAGAAFFEVDDELWFTAPALERQEPGRFAVYEDATGQYDDYDLDIDGVVEGVVVDGDVAYLWGAFNTVGGEARSGFAAVDLATRAVLPLSLTFGGDIDTLAVGAGVLYVAGSITNVNGQGVDTFAIVDTNTGDLVSGPALSGRVSGIADLGDQVVVGGAFSVDGGASTSLAWFSTATFEPLTTTAPLGPSVDYLELLGNDLVVNSNTSAGVSGLPSADALFALEPRLGTPRAWQPGFQSLSPPVVDLGRVGGTIIAVGPRLRVLDERDGFFVFDETTAAVVPWDPGLISSAIGVGVVEVGNRVAAVGQNELSIVDAPQP